MEIVKCNICSSGYTDLFFEKDDFKIVKCRECVLVYVNPRLTLDELKEFYDESYYFYKDIEILKIEKNVKSVDRIRKHMPGGVGRDVRHWLFHRILFKYREKIF